MVFTARIRGAIGTVKVYLRPFSSQTRIDFVFFILTFDFDLVGFLEVTGLGGDRSRARRLGLAVEQDF